MRKKSVFRGAWLLALTLGTSEGTSGGPELLPWLGGSS